MLARNTRIASLNLLAKLFDNSDSMSGNLYILWLDARKNKDGVINNEKVQEVANHVVALKEKSIVVSEGEKQNPNTQELLDKEVEIDVIVNDDALLSIPIDDDTLIVRGVIGTYVA
ncbi:hypothetical protein Lal_00018672 [Lupinus albus]|nr:hypothetical protein Lal_00018672 [Lupinus albus]